MPAGFVVVFGIVGCEGCLVVLFVVVVFDVDVVVLYCVDV